jgi:methionine-rich copper-binding protein CopC
MNAPALTLLGGTVLTFVVGASTTAWAHSFPEQESPPAGATLSEPPAQVTIKYDAPIEELFASLAVLNSAGQNEAAGKPEVSSDGWKLSVTLNKLPPGEYTVQWSVVCIDTHHTQGSYSFTIEGSHL